jgi:hypothetical protein
MEQEMYLRVLEDRCSVIKMFRKKGLAGLLVVNAIYSLTIMSSI